MRESTLSACWIAGERRGVDARMKSPWFALLALLFLLSCRSKDRAPESELHGFPIRKTLRIPRDEIAKLTSPVAKALGHGPEASCFEPHHGLHIVTATGEALDLAICFACNEVEAHRGDGDGTWIPIDDTAEAVFARYLGPTPEHGSNW